MAGDKSEFKQTIPNEPEIIHLSDIERNKRQTMNFKSELTLTFGRNASIPLIFKPQIIVGVFVDGSPIELASISPEAGSSSMNISRPGYPIQWFSSYIQQNNVNLGRYPQPENTSPSPYYSAQISRRHANVVLKKPGELLIQNTSNNSSFIEVRSSELSGICFNLDDKYKIMLTELTPEERKSVDIFRLSRYVQCLEDKIYFSEEHTWFNKLTKGSKIKSMQKLLLSLFISEMTTEDQTYAREFLKKGGKQMLSQGFPALFDQLQSDQILGKYSFGSLQKSILAKYATSLQEYIFTMQYDNAGLEVDNALLVEVGKANRDGLEHMITLSQSRNKNPLTDPQPKLEDIDDQRIKEAEERAKKAATARERNDALREKGNIVYQRIIENESEKEALITKKRLIRMITTRLHPDTQQARVVQKDYIDTLSLEEIKILKLESTKAKFSADALNYSNAVNTDLYFVSQQEQQETNTLEGIVAQRPSEQAKILQAYLIVIDSISTLDVEAQASESEETFNKQLQSYEDRRLFMKLLRQVVLIKEINFSTLSYVNKLNNEANFTNMNAYLQSLLERH